MAVLPRPASPRAVLADLREIVRRGDRRQKLIAGVVAVGMTSLIVTLFIVESWYGVLPEGQQITYAAEFASTRTDAEIIAQQKIDQKKLDAAREARRQEWQQVDKRLSKLGI